MPNVRGNRRLTGTYAEVWWGGIKVAEASKISVKLSINREDVQIGQDIDSKMVSQKGEFSMTLKRIYSMYDDMLAEFQAGRDPRTQVITKLADPDTKGAQQERYSIDNVWVNEVPVVNYEQGGLVEDELTGGFTPSDLIPLDRIKQ